MDPLLRQIIQIVNDALLRWERSSRGSVCGFPGFDHGEVESHAQYLATLLWRGRCCCGLPSCRARHHLPDPAPADDPPRLRAAVRSAVVGTWRGQEIQTGSLKQSMLYRWILTREYGLVIAEVEFHACPSQGCAGGGYEGPHCPQCHTPFDPARDRAFVRERLVRQDLRSPLVRWKCQAGKGLCEHVYAQIRCRQGRHDAGQHDRCPWVGCPQRPPRHSQRESVVWVRRRGDVSTDRHEDDRPDGAAYEAACLAGTGAWWGQLEPDRRQTLAAYVSRLLGAGAGQVEAEAVAAWLLWHPAEVTEGERNGWLRSVAAAAEDRDLTPSSGG
jgi:hypothetical protein